MMTTEQRQNSNEAVDETTHDKAPLPVPPVKLFPKDGNRDEDMANKKQCISCNREMPVSSESCICGHVLSDIKSLEGKRYSGYREELYSRLEIRRILEDNDKPKRPRLKQKSSPKQGISSVLHQKHMKRKRNRRKPSHMAPTQAYQKNNTAPKPTEFEDNPDLWYLNPRFNFADALADINKRLTSQSSFWISL